MQEVHANKADFTFVAGQFQSNELRVLSFRGQETMSRPFRFELRLVSEDRQIRLESLIKEPGLLSISGLNGTRHVHGIVSSFDQIAVGRKFALYELVLTPSLTPLSFIQNNRIFQQMDVAEIVQAVIAQAGFSGDSLRTVLASSYGKRDYCVQYQESDFAFISRLLEEEGIFYFFEHSDKSDVFVIGDSSEGSYACPQSPILNYRDESLATVLAEESVYRFHSGALLASGTATLNDYRFKQPKVPMSTSKSAGSFPMLEVYEFPGEYVDPTIGKSLVRTRVEELQMGSTRHSGIGSSRSLIPGYQVSLANHPCEDLNQAYLLLSVTHEGSQPQSLLEEEGAEQQQSTTYQSSFTAQPLSKPFRPARTTPRPRIPGVQTAVVVGPEGQEIYSDSFGRVKVQFKWDRYGSNDDGSSCWVRVNQPWGGIGFGAIFIPRIGQEVLIQFIEGDPDRPVIIGRVYNGDNPVPYPLPAKQAVSTIKTRSTPGGNGFNELRFTDTASAEEIFLHAQKDYNGVVLNDQTLRVDHNRSKSIGVDQSETVGNNKQIQVGSNHSEAVGKNMSISVGMNLEEKVGQNYHEKVEETYSLKARTIYLEAKELIQIKVGKSLIVMNKDGNILVQGTNIAQKASETISSRARLITKN